LAKFYLNFHYTKVVHIFSCYQNLHSLGLFSSHQRYNLNLDYDQRNKNNDTNDDECNGPSRNGGGTGIAGKCRRLVSFGVDS